MKASTSRVTRFWQYVPKPLRMTLVILLGVPIIVAGIAMLALPGPGWAAILLGFAVLATEFTFATKVRDWLIGYLKNLLLYLKLRANIFLDKLKRKQ